jgi:hypothetical protein
MKLSMTIFLALALAGCSMVEKEDAKIAASNAAEEAAVKRMIVAQGETIPGHPALTELGKVQGVCGRPPAYDDASSYASVGLKHAAYDRFGDKVDGIIRVDSFFVIGNAASATMEPGSSEGHLECRGTAVHFEQK